MGMDAERRAKVVRRAPTKSPTTENVLPTTREAVFLRQSEIGKERATGSPKNLPLGLETLRPAETRPSCCSQGPSTPEVPT